MWGADWPWLLRTARRRRGQGRRAVLPLRRVKSAGARGRTGMIISNRFGLLQGCALTSRSVPRKASSCHPRLRLGIQVFVLLQGFPLPSRSVHRKASSCQQGPAKYTSGQSFYDHQSSHHRPAIKARSPITISMIVLPILIRNVMIMALMLAIAMMMMAKQRCTSIVRTRGWQPPTTSTKLKRQQHLRAMH